MQQINSNLLVDNNTRTGYTKLSNELKGHLDGISSKLEEISILMDDIGSILDIINGEEI